MQTPVLLGLAVFWVGAASAPTFGVAQSNPAVQQAIATYPVRGVVLNSLTQQPIARALVDGSLSAVLTDGEGRFELNLPEGMIPITARRPTYNNNGQEMQHLVNVGGNMPDLTFYLTPQAGIHGHIALSSGEDADNFHLMVYHKVNFGGRERWESGTLATTDSEGNFRLTILDSPSSWVVCTLPVLDSSGVRAAGKRIAPTSGFGYSSVCYPGPVPTIGSANSNNTIPLVPGQQAEIELTLVRQPFYRVSIAVPNAARSQNLGIEIHDQSGRVLEFGAEWKPDLGVAEVYLPNGHYSAEASHQDQGTRHGRIDFQVANAPVLGLNLILLPLHPIPVEIRKDFTVVREGDVRGGAAGELSRIDTDPGVYLTLTSADSATYGMVGGSIVQRQDGSESPRFEIEGTVPGRYWVNANAYEGYISSITSGGGDLTREPLVVGPGNTVAPIQVTLRNDGGQISCTVNRPAASAETPQTASGQTLGEIRLYFIYAIPLSRTQFQIPQIQGQSQDMLQIPNVPPGTYRVVAFDKMQTFDLSNPQEMARITRNGQTVTVTAGTTAPVQLDLIHVDGPGADTSSDSGDPQL